MCGICGCGEAHGQHRHKERGQAGPERRHLQVELDLFAQNNRYARENRERFERGDLLVLNLMSSPGAGKTELLVATLKHQLGRYPIGVIEGDQQTQHDVERVRTTGVDAVQINTGKLCHLDAHMIGHALEQLPNLKGGILYIENVGNLVCPAAFDLGEDAKVVILSVAEGADKPLKYPDMFHCAQLMVINKIDLLPYVDFDVATCIEYARRINPDIQVVQLSARTGEGMGEWFEWLAEQRSSRPLD
ncbi:hydrogenase nickel incorporation protein HypB [Marinobacterium marinum]|uniref:Hydrogenase maturation factor HypB n=1 Tax=Marinobacterium marinum TaxID=2756129 RepID=A0A7W1WX47_9GAMM|nr:hydrogenase nickel incorporation protein HypB [Marinobacterium marinum]MBA4501788.1 hydrogenase nickel incorporation protein HypB [Marinobacterium marinum]